LALVLFGLLVIAAVGGYVYYSQTAIDSSSPIVTASSQVQPQTPPQPQEPETPAPTPEPVSSSPIVTESDVVSEDTPPSQTPSQTPPQPQEPEKPVPPPAAKPSRYFKDIYTEEKFGPLLKKPVKIPGSSFSLLAYKEEKDGSTVALYGGSIGGTTRQTLVKNGLDEVAANRVDSNKFIYRYTPDGKKYQRLHDGYYAADNELLFDGPVTKDSLNVRSDQTSGKGYVKIPGKQVKAAETPPVTVQPKPPVSEPNKPATPPAIPVNANELYSKGEERYDAKDYKSAFTYFSQAANAGHAGAQNYLGFMYQNGYGVEQNYAEAVSWYRKAANAGNANAQNNLGFMYEQGYGVTKNYAEAVSWYRKAAAQGEPYAKNALERLQKEGKIK
jgi:hypothetical protein